MQLPVNDDGNSAASAGATTPVSRLFFTEKAAPAILSRWS